MKFFHVTTARASRLILAKGFRDVTGSCLMEGVKVSGVFVSNLPVTEMEGAKGDTLLQIELKLSRHDSAFYELKEEGKPYREWCLPARILNRGRVRKASAANAAPRDSFFLRPIDHPTEVDPPFDAPVTLLPAVSLIFHFSEPVEKSLP